MVGDDIQPPLEQQNIFSVHLNQAIPLRYSPFNHSPLFFRRLQFHNEKQFLMQGQSSCTTFSLFVLWSSLFCLYQFLSILVFGEPNTGRQSNTTRFYSRRIWFTKSLHLHRLFWNISPRNKNVEQPTIEIHYFSDILCL